MLLAFCWPAQAQQNIIGGGVYGGAEITSGYTGPGDLVAATAWYGLRAYNAAKAAATVKAVNLRRASDNTAQDILVKTNGDLDTASANTFAGTDANCTGSMVGTTTLTVTACSSGTLNVNDTITGPSIIQPAYITAIGTCAAPPGTCTMNVAQTFASEAIVAQVALFATKLYDQTAGNNCGAATCDVAQATAANQPQFIPTCINSLPCLQFTSITMTLTAAHNFTPATGALTLSAVFFRSNSGTGNFLFRQNGGAGRNRFSAGVANTWALAGPTNSVNFTANDNAWHSVNGVINGASSVINADGTETSGTVTGGTGAGGPNITLLTTATTSNAGEFGFWDAMTFSGTQRTNMCHNQFVYWGTATSC